MKLNASNFKNRSKWLKLSAMSAGIVVSLPLIVVACGESDTPATPATPETPVTPTTPETPVTPTTPVTPLPVNPWNIKAYLENEFAPRVYATSNSVVNDVRWTSDLPVLPANAASYNAPEYSTTYYASESEALKDTDDSHWSKALPTKANPDWQKRYLWVRLINPNTPSFSAAYELTKSSRYKYVAASDEDIAKERDELVVKQAQNYLDQSLRPNIQVESYASANALIWKGLPYFPVWIAENYHIEYGVPQVNFKDNEAAAKDKTSGVWTATLPTSIPFEIAKRFMWVRLVNTSNDALSIAKEITDSSHIKDLPDEPYVRVNQDYFDNEFSPLIVADLATSTLDNVKWVNGTPRLSPGLAKLYEAPVYTYRNSSDGVVFKELPTNFVGKSLELVVTFIKKRDDGAIETSSYFLGPEKTKLDQVAPAKTS